MGLTRTRIEEIRSKLQTMPPPPPSATVETTKQEAVRLLAREIAGLQRRGYSLEQIAKTLRGEGLDVLTPTLKSYLARAKARRARGKVAGRATRVAGGADATAATEVASVVMAKAARSAGSKSTGKDAPPVTVQGSVPIALALAQTDRAATTTKADAVAGSEPALRSGKDAFLIKDKDSY